MTGYELHNFATRNRRQTFAIRTAPALAATLPAKPSSPRVSAHSVVAASTNSLPAVKAALSLFHRLQGVEAASAV
jgi:hypothetical protein